MKLTFLGTGTSFGVPQIGCDCKVCKSTDPRDKRSRVAVLLEGESGVRILIDTPPELRLQLIAAGVSSLDAVLFTHDHADHTHGIDDIRAFTARRGKALPAYGSADVLARLSQRFPYIFDAAIRPMAGTWKPEVIPVVVNPGVPFQIGDVSVQPVQVPHGDMTVLGFRAGSMAYITDAKSVPPEALEIIKGVEVLVLNALLHKPHPSHLSFGEAIEVGRAAGARRIFFTHLTHQHSHASLAAELPEGFEPAYDGLVVEVY